MKSRILLFNFLMCTHILLLSQPGSIDLTFGAAGKVNTVFGVSNNHCRSLVLQPDGKIVVAGDSWNGTKADFTLVRYKSNGSIDSSFGNSGFVIAPIGNAEDQAQAIALQSDGKLLVTGITHNGVNYDIAVARFNANGTFDTSFSSDGKLILAIGTDKDYAFAIAQQSDGKILVAGSTTLASGNEFALIRFKSNGVLDTSFSADGIVTTDFGASFDNAYAMAIQTDGKILLAGYKYTTLYDFAIARYNTNGSLDTTFSNDGKTTISFDNYNEIAYALQVQTDGKILVAGYRDDATSNKDFAIARLNADGSLDNSFDSDGKVATAIGNFNDGAYSISIQVDGKILVSGYGYSLTANDDNFAVARYNANGSLDNTFGSGGKVTSDFGSSNDYGYSASIQTDGKLVVAGTRWNSSKQDFILARYNTGSGSGINYFNNTSEILIYPNPFYQSTNIEIYNFDFTACEMMVYNLLGELVDWKSISSNKQQISFNLPEGIYCFKVCSVEGAKIGTGRFIKN